MHEHNISMDKGMPKINNLWQAAILASSHFLNDIFTSILSPLLPLLIENYSLSKFEAGLMAALVSWPSVLQPIFGRLGDKTNLKKYIFLFPLITGTFMSLIGVAPNIGVIAGSLLIAGISSACFHAVAPPIAGKISGAHSGKGLSLWMIGGELGFALGPILIIAFVNSFSLKSTPILIIFAALASIFQYFRLNKIDEIKNHIPVQHRSTKSSFKAIAPMLIPIVFVAASRSLISSSTNVYIPTYLTERGINLWLAGTALSLIMVGSIFGTIIGGIYNDKIGGKPILFASIIGSSLFFFIFLYTQSAVQIVALFITGFFAGMYLPVALTMVQDYSPENRSFANGIYLAFLFTIGALSNMLIGYLYDQFGGQFTFILSGIVSLLGVIFTLFIPGRHSAIEKEKSEA